jgi:hypothetical protein
MKSRLFFGGALLLATSLACSLTSTSVGLPATDLSQPTTAASPVPLDTSPPTLPAATATATITTDGSGIELDGPDEFVVQAQSALDLLAVCDPAALATVDTQLEAIVYSDRSGMDVDRGAFLASDTTAFAPGYPPEAQVFWFAGAIVHDAHHRQQAANGATTNWDQLSLQERQAIEHDARAVQLEAMENCLDEVPEADQSQATGMINYLTGMQTGEIPCDYCEVEWADRDW